MSRNPTIKFDRLKMYFARPYVIDLEGAEGTVIVRQPTIGEIVDIGEERFYQTLYIFISNTTSYRLPLWKNGIDWNTESDFNLFIRIYENSDPEVSKLLFEDLDLANFEPCLKVHVEVDDDGNETESTEVILQDMETGTQITEEVYWHFSQYLRKCFSINPEEKITDDPVLKTWYIQKDERALKNKEKKSEDDESSSSLVALISTCVNHPGFKYKAQELNEIPVYQFFDSVSRLQVYENTTALLKGMYSGMIDASKIKPEAYNFMKEI